MKKRFILTLEIIGDDNTELDLTNGHFRKEIGNEVLTGAEEIIDLTYREVPLTAPQTELEQINNE